jgi:hypothetical protein
MAAHAGTQGPAALERGVLGIRLFHYGRNHRKAGPGRKQAMHSNEARGHDRDAGHILLDVGRGLQTAGKYRKHIPGKALLSAVLVTSVLGLSRVAAVGETVSGPPEPVTGYAYVCNGTVLVQEVKEHNGDQVTVSDNVESPNSTEETFEVFQSSRPEKCAAMAAPFSGAVPGTLLVAVTWAAPHLVVVMRTSPIRAK